MFSTRRYLSISEASAYPAAFVNEHAGVAARRGTDMAAMVDYARCEMVKVNKWNMDKWENERNAGDDRNERRMKGWLVGGGEMQMAVFGECSMVCVQC